MGHSQLFVLAGTWILIGLALGFSVASGLVRNENFSQIEGFLLTAPIWGIPLLLGGICVWLGYEQLKRAEMQGQCDQEWH